MKIYSNWNAATPTVITLLGSNSDDFDVSDNTVETIIDNATITTSAADDDTTVDTVTYKRMIEVNMTTVTYQYYRIIFHDVWSRDNQASTVKMVDINYIEFTDDIFPTPILMMKQTENDTNSSGLYPASYAYLFVTNEQSDGFSSNYKFYDSSGNEKGLTNLDEFGTYIKNYVDNIDVTGDGPIINITDSRLNSITVAITQAPTTNNSNDNWTSEFPNTTNPEIFDSDEFDNATWRSLRYVKLYPEWIGGIPTATSRWSNLEFDPSTLTIWNGTQEESNGSYFYTTDFQLSWKPVFIKLYDPINNKDQYVLLVTEYGVEALFNTDTLYGLTGNSFSTIPDASGVTSISGFSDFINDPDGTGSVIQDRGIFITFTDSNGDSQSPLIRRFYNAGTNGWFPNFIDLGGQLDHYYSSTTGRDDLITFQLIGNNATINYDNTTSSGINYWWTTDFTFSFQFIRFSDSQSMQDDVANMTTVTWSSNISTYANSFYKNEDEEDGIGNVVGIWIQFNEYQKSNYTNGKDLYKTTNKFLNIYADSDSVYNLPTEVVVLGSNNAIHFVSNDEDTNEAKLLFEGNVTTFDSNDSIVINNNNRRGCQINMSSTETYDYYRIIFKPEENGVGGLQGASATNLKITYLEFTDEEYGV
tara:strand:+ start:289 stop:2217 length:1929 start_codon:yes stop_codon:yes gene_type:complete